MLAVKCLVGTSDFVCYVPSLRKLEQFDQIMTEYGLWSKAKWDHLRENIDNKSIQKKMNSLEIPPTAMPTPYLRRLNTPTAKAKQKQNLSQRSQKGADARR